MPASSAVRYRTLASLVAAAGLAYLCRNAVGVAESTIRSDLGLTVKQSGVFLGAFFWTYAIFQIPSGIFAQRFGTRIALTMFASLWAIATLGIAGATSFWPLIAAQLVMGVAQAGIFPASCQSIRHWMPMAQRALACGLLAAGMQIGAVVASGLTGELIEITSWRWIFVLYALPCLVWSVGFFMFFRDRPEESHAVSPAELKLIRGKPEGSPDNRKTSKTTKQTQDGARKEPSDSISWLAIIRSTTVWFLCGQQICRAAGYMFFASWFPTFLQETRGISVRDSGYLQGLVLLGTLAGGIVGGWLVDWVWRRTNSLRYSRSGLSAICLSVCGLVDPGGLVRDQSSVGNRAVVRGCVVCGTCRPRRVFDHHRHRRNAHSLRSSG